MLFCGYHGWHDWYISANLSDSDTLNDHLRPGIDPLGVPAALAGTSIPFEYNDIDSLRAALDANRDEVACIILEPARTYQPENGYLHKVRDIADEYGVVLIFERDRDRGSGTAAAARRSISASRRIWASSERRWATGSR